MDYEIKHFSDGPRGRFYLVDAETTVGELTYRMRDAVMYVDHAVVSPTLRGEGLGRVLVDACVEYARGHNLLIRPVCSYVKKVMDEDAELHDVLDTVKGSAA